MVLEIQIYRDRDIVLVFSIYHILLIVYIYIYTHHICHTHVTYTHFIGFIYIERGRGWRGETGWLPGTSSCNYGGWEAPRHAGWSVKLETQPLGINCHAKGGRLESQEEPCFSGLQRQEKDEVPTQRLWAGGIRSYLGAGVESALCISQTFIWLDQAHPPWGSPYAQFGALIQMLISSPTLLQTLPE